MGKEHLWQGLKNFLGKGRGARVRKTGHALKEPERKRNDWGDGGKSAFIKEENAGNNESQWKVATRGEMRGLGQEKPLREGGEQRAEK